MIDAEKTTRLKQVYSDLPLEQQIRLLASLALNITVGARGSYPSQENEDDHETIKNSLAEIIGFNEVQQTVTGQLGRMIDGDKNRYPDDVFMAIVLEEVKSGRCGKGLLSALKFSFNRLGVSLE